LWRWGQRVRAGEGALRRTRLLESMCIIQPNVVNCNSRRQRRAMVKGPLGCDRGSCGRCQRHAAGLTCASGRLLRCNADWLHGGSRLLPTRAAAPPLVSTGGVATCKCRPLQDEAHPAARLSAPPGRMRVADMA
jgi:hypothetical protein